MSNLWTFISRPKNRTILGWLGGGLVVLAGGIWTVFTYMHPHDPHQGGDIVQQGVVIKGPMDHSTVHNQVSGSTATATAPPADAAEAKAPTAAPASQEHKK